MDRQHRVKAVMKIVRWKHYDQQGPEMLPQGDYEEGMKGSPYDPDYLQHTWYNRISINPGSIKQGMTRTRTYVTRTLKAIKYLKDNSEYEVADIYKWYGLSRFSFNRYLSSAWRDAGVVGLADGLMIFHRDKAIELVRSLVEVEEE